MREKLKASYSDTGRPSIDLELLLRILLIGYLYGITGERKQAGVGGSTPSLSWVNRTLHTLFAT